MADTRRAFHGRLSMPVGRSRLERLLRPVMPLYRLARRRTEYRWARYRAHRPQGSGGLQTPAAFILGSGRSGTTLVGALLGSHPDVVYLFEPWHIWAAINPLTDSLGRYEEQPGRCMMDQSQWDAAQSCRFEALVRSRGRRSGARLVVEKSPINTMRIGWLEALAPGSRYLNVLRDGGDVAGSVARVADQRPYRVGLCQLVDQWWGVNQAKWKALAAEGAASGYFSDEVASLSGNLEKGAYEWLVSLGETERARPGLTDRICDVRYDGLTAHPAEVMLEMARFLGLEVDQEWIERGVSAVGAPSMRSHAPLVLPPRMAASFNTYQAALGFPTRARPAVTETD